MAACNYLHLRVVDNMLEVSSILMILALLFACEALQYDPLDVSPIDHNGPHTSRAVHEAGIHDLKSSEFITVDSL